MKSTTLYGNCFEEYITVTQTRDTVKISFKDVSESVKETIMQRLAAAIMEDTGFSFEADL